MNPNPRRKKNKLINGVNQSYYPSVDATEGKIQQVSTGLVYEHSSGPWPTPHLERTERARILVTDSDAPVSDKSYRRANPFGKPPT
jgi:hypothetical protein